jgi:NAD(P)-dependent dehydrogenase (short-subunit alcohol dehydrogenase family)
VSSEPTGVAIVTGASHGIGAGLVAAFRGAGYAVVGTSRSIVSSDEPDFLTVPGDIAEPATAERVVERALERYGRISSRPASSPARPCTSTAVRRPDTDGAGVVRPHGSRSSPRASKPTETRRVRAPLLDVIQIGG